MRLRESSFPRKVVRVMFALLWVLALSGAGTAWAQETSLMMQSEQGEYVGQGKNYSYTPATGTFTSFARDFDNDGKPETVRISYNGNQVGTQSPDRWSLEFSTQALSRPLTVGTYVDAQRAAFADDGHPGLDVSGNGRGSNKLTGSFVIEQVEFDTSDANNPKVVSFAASFVQNSEGLPPTLRGTVKFNATVTAEPTATPVATPTVPAPNPTTGPAPTPTTGPAPTPTTGPAPTPTTGPPNGDRIAPTATFTMPSGGQIVRALPVLRGRLSDNAGGSGIAGVEITILRFDGKTWSGNSWENSILRVPGLVVGNQWGFNNVPRGANLPDGIYRLAVWPLDRAGNRGLNIITLRIDATSPQLRWATPSAVVENSAPQLYAVQIVDVGGIKTVQIAIQRSRDGGYWNGRDWQRTPVALPAQFNGTYGVLRTGVPPSAALDDGSYLLIALVTDSAGNRSRADQSLVLRGFSSPNNGGGGTPSLVRLSTATARGAQNAIDLVFTGPLQIASLYDTAVFRAIIDGREAEIVDIAYVGSARRVTLKVNGLIKPGARIQVTYSGLLDAQAAPLVAGSASFETPQ